MAAIELPREQMDIIFAQSGDDTTIGIDIEAQKLTVQNGHGKNEFSFEISPFDKALVLAGGWVDYADKKY